MPKPIGIDRPGEKHPLPRHLKTFLSLWLMRLILYLLRVQNMLGTSLHQAKCYVSHHNKLCTLLSSFYSFDALLCIDIDMLFMLMSRLDESFAVYLETTGKSDVINIKLPDELKICHCKAVWQFAWNMNEDQQRRFD